MYMAQTRFGAAQARYQNVDLASRIEAASPHRLVAILLDELLKSLDAMAAACRVSDFAQRGQRQSRALAILHGLEGSLDYDKGGDIAASLAAIYGQARRLILAGAAENDPAHLVKARDMIAEIASAWDAIA
jgi:flagellar secretion chaperone FliS